jgi:hypothetical protein
MEQFILAAAKYDPKYTDKVKEVVKVIENALSGSPYFSFFDVNRHLEFDCSRYLRLLCRRGFLISAPSREGKRAVYRCKPRRPPGKSFDRRSVADHLSPRLAFISLGPRRPGAPARRCMPGRHPFSLTAGYLAGIFTETDLMNELNDRSVAFCQILRQRRMSAHHVLEMFRRILTEADPASAVLDRMLNCLTKIAAELRKLATG